MVSVRETPAAPQGPSRAAAAQLALLAAMDASAWRDLFEQNFRKMYNFAYVRTGDANLAEEVASEVFAAAVRGIGRYRDTGAPIAAWLYRIARNITADHLDRRRRRPQTSLDAVQVESRNWSREIEEQTDLARGLAQLPREQQEVIALRFYSDCSLQETAQAMGKSVGAVKVLQHRALRTLRVKLTDGGV